VRKHLFLDEYESGRLQQILPGIHISGIADQEPVLASLPRKKEILCAVAIKLIKVIFALLRDKLSFEDKR